MGLGKLEKKLLIGGLLASMALGCSDEISPVEPVKKSPTEQPSNPPANNHPPVFTSSPVINVDENSDYRYQAKATDADGNKLVFSALQKPGWISVSNEGLVTGRAPEVSKDESQSISLSASDGKVSITQNYSIITKNLFNNHVISQQDMNGITIGENSISFANPVAYAAGDFVAAGITDKTPDGLLRKVVSVSQDKKRVATETAVIEEILRDGNASFSGSLDNSDVDSSSMPNGAVFSKAHTQEEYSFVVNFNDVVLYDADGNEFTKQDQLLANGNFSFSTDFDFSATIADYGITEMIFKNKTKINSEITVSSNMMGLSSVLETKAAEFKFKPFVAGYLPTVPPVPIVLVPHLEIKVGIDPSKINPLSITSKENASVETSIAYWNGNLVPGFNFSNDFEFSNPVISKEVELSVYAGPNLNILVYGVAGPFAGIRGKVRLHATDQKWELYGGLEALLGIRADILSKKVSAQVQQVIHNEKLIVQSSSPVSSDSVIIRPGAEGKDATVGHVVWPDGSESYSGNGDSSSMELKHDYPGNHGSEKEGLLEFSLSQLPSNAVVDLATLKFTGWATQNYLNDIPTISISKLNNLWEESSVKWDTKPAGQKISKIDFINDGKVSQYEVDVTEAVKEWSSGNPNHGFGFSVEDGVRGEIYSSDNSDASKRPALVIKYH